MDRHILELRTRRRRSLFATLLFSQGVPMILGGDEIGRTQRGNNNAYNQDNDVSWYDWDAADEEFLEFCRATVTLRRRHPTFRRVAWLHEHVGSRRRDRDHAGWYRPDGNPMTDDDWSSPDAAVLTLYLDGHHIPAAAGVVDDDDILLCMNGSPTVRPFTLPPDVTDGGWIVLLDTVEPNRSQEPPAPTFDVAPFGLVLLARSHDVTPAR